MDNAVASASKLAHRSGASMTPSSETRVDSISLRIVVLFLSVPRTGDGGRTSARARACARRPASVPLVAYALRERRQLALERLGHAVAPALSQGLGHGIGEDVLLFFLDGVEDGSRDGL